jgi:hypothetical protein
LILFFGGFAIVMNSRTKMAERRIVKGKDDIVKMILIFRRTDKKSRNMNVFIFR